MVDDFLRLSMFEVVPPGQAEMDAAYAAFVAFGKDSGHAANLNFGDVFSYALAKVRALPVLFKGNDFRKPILLARRKSGNLRDSLLIIFTAPEF